MLPQLITRELWHGLNHALPRHPLLWYPLRGHDPEPAQNTMWFEVVPTVILIGAIALSMLLWAAYGISPLILILLLDTYAGVVVVRGVTAAMQRARTRGLLDLMSVTPSGQMGAVWAVMTRYLRSDQTIAGLHQAAGYVHAMWLFALLPFGALVVITVCGSASFNQTEIGAIFNQPLTLLNGGVVLGVMLLDYLGALVSGALVGMIAPTFTSIRADASLFVPLAYVAAQALNYAALFLLHVVLTAVLSVPGWLSGWSSSAAFVLSFVIVREASLWLLCLILARRMNVSVRDVLTIHRRSL